jgi:hypothetical protein
VGLLEAFTEKEIDGDPLIDKLVKGEREEDLVPDVEALMLTLADTLVESLGDRVELMQEVGDAEI